MYYFVSKFFKWCLFYFNFNFFQLEFAFNIQGVSVLDGNQSLARLRDFSTHSFHSIHFAFYILKQCCHGHLCSGLVQLSNKSFLLSFCKAFYKKVLYALMSISFANSIDIVVFLLVTFPRHISHPLPSIFNYYYFLSFCIRICLINRIQLDLKYLSIVGRFKSGFISVLYALYSSFFFFSLLFLLFLLLPIECLPICLLTIAFFFFPIAFFCFRVFWKFFPRMFWE